MELSASIQALSDAIDLNDLEELVVSSPPFTGHELYEIPSSPPNESPPRVLVVNQKQLLRHYAAAQAAVKQGRRQNWTQNVAQRLNAATKVVLLQTAEHHTALNLRKRLVVSGYVDREAELRWTELLMTLPSSSKALELWHHHRFLSNSTDAETPEVQVDQQVQFALRCAVRYRRNYAAWSHLAQLRVSTVQQLQPTAAHMRQNLTDHSAVAVHNFHLRQLQDTDLWRDTWDEAMDRLKTYAHIETSWLHPRMLLQIGQQAGWPPVAQLRQQFEAEARSCAGYEGGESGVDESEAPATTERVRTLAQEQAQQAQTARHHARQSLLFTQHFL